MESKTETNGRMGFIEIPESEKRLFTERRREQGFRSQEHLDAFYRYYDHVGACAECQRPGPAMWFDDCYQPTHNLCPEGRRLDNEKRAERFTDVIDHGSKVIHDMRDQPSHRLHEVSIAWTAEPPEGYRFSRGWADGDGRRWAVYCKRLPLQPGDA